jgi:FkbH-like protein
MKRFIYRNYTIEYLFDIHDHFSGYGDLLFPLDNFDEYLIFYQINPVNTPSRQLDEVEEIKSKIEFLIHNIPAERRIVIFTLREEYLRNWKSASPEVLMAIKGLNDFINSNCPSLRNTIKVIDINSFITDAKMPFIDEKYFFISQMIINPKLKKDFKIWFSIQLNSINLIRKKCIVLDCDNTLWGGVVGEEGPLGIKIGQDYPGLCFLKFQELLVEVSEKGVILAVCSKNNHDDVLEVWKKNPFNILNDSHITIYKINWTDKATNIMEIASELNIGLDSIVFIDDNPVEREFVKAFLPEVEIPDFPDQPYQLVKYFWEKIYNPFFLTYQFSDEDLNKTNQYRENFARTRAKTEFNSMDEYLSSLGMEIEISEVDNFTIQRISQMTQKTNQFNLTTKRYTEANLHAKIKGGSTVFCARVKDKFGDNGITIASIFDINDEVVSIDSYLLSCRILGRGIEIITLQYLLNHLFSLGRKKINSVYIPTKKNSMVENFYEKVGFALIDKSADGSKLYELKMNAPFEIKPYYKIINNGKQN